MMNTKSVYLDNNAATQPDPRVVSAVQHYLENVIGNPSSAHTFGRTARQVLTKCRDNIAHYLGVRSDEIVFTSSGTESANMILRGVADLHSGGHIITSSVEHSCVYNTIKELEKWGYDVTYLSPGLWGAVTAVDVEQALRPDTRLISLMSANHETGVKTDITAIAVVAKKARIPFFVDGVALLGKEAVTIPEGVSAMGFSGQKIHAMQGIGFCWIKKNLKLSPLLFGGEQQFLRRAGTENLPGIVALSKAIDILREEGAEAAQIMLRHRNHFEKTLLDRFPFISVNGEGPRVVNTSNLCFMGREGEALLTALDMNGVAASHGSACASGSLEPSRVLVNMGYPMERVLASLRFSFSRFTSAEEIDLAIEKISQILG